MTLASQRNFRSEDYLHDLIRLLHNYHKDRRKLRFGFGDDGDIVIDYIVKLRNLDMRYVAEITKLYSEKDDRG